MAHVQHNYIMCRKKASQINGLLLLTVKVFQKVKMLCEWANSRGQKHKILCGVMTKRQKYAYSYFVRFPVK